MQHTQLQQPQTNSWKKQRKQDSHVANTVPPAY